jgi:hypothetical protein
VVSTFEWNMEYAGCDEKDLESFGFKLSPGGAHISRTLMLREIERLLRNLPATAEANDYRRAILDENILGKKTQATREKTFRYLRELYAISEVVPLFVIYRELLLSDVEASPLLSVLVACARDSLLRSTVSAIISASVGSEVPKNDLEIAISNCFPEQYSDLNVAKIARNAASSWTQSGHLSGRSKKIRIRATPIPAVAAFAVMLGYVCGQRGEALFSSMWCRLLDLSPSEARMLAEQAHRQDLLTLRSMGPVVEVSFPRFTQYMEGCL